MRSKIFQHSIELLPKKIEGRKEFEVKLVLRNLSSNPVFIEPIHFSSSSCLEISNRISTMDNALHKLETERIDLIEKLEKSVKKLLLKQYKVDKLKEENSNRLVTFSKIILESVSAALILSPFSNVFELKTDELPDYFGSIIEINTSKDLELIEQHLDAAIIESDSALSRPHLILKQKLEKCEREIFEMSGQVAESLRFTKIEPISEILVHFNLKSKSVISEIEDTLSFTSNVLDTNNTILEQLNISHECTIHPTRILIPIGAFFGAVFGYFAKYSLLNYDNTHPIFEELAIISIFSVVCVFILRKSTEKKKPIPITIDDMYGGIALGVLFGFKTDFFISYFEKLAS